MCWRSTRKPDVGTLNSDSNQFSFTVLEWNTGSNFFIRCPSSESSDKKVEVFRPLNQKQVRNVSAWQDLKLETSSYRRESKYLPFIRSSSSSVWHFYFFSSCSHTVMINLNFSLKLFSFLSATKRKRCVIMFWPVHVCVHVCSCVCYYQKSLIKKVIIGCAYDSLHFGANMV